MSEKIEIRNSPVQGRGIFAVQSIAEGKLVMQYDDDLYSVEDRGEDDGYFINHSCDPNLWLDGPVTLIARRDIRIGEEFTADYALWEVDEKKYLIGNVTVVLLTAVVV